VPENFCLESIPFAFLVVASFTCSSHALFGFSLSDLSVGVSFRRVQLSPPPLSRNFHSCSQELSQHFPPLGLNPTYPLFFYFSTPVAFTGSPLQMASLFEFSFSYLDLRMLFPIPRSRASLPLFCSPPFFFFVGVAPEGLNMIDGFSSRSRSLFLTNRRPSFSDSL